MACMWMAGEEEGGAFIVAKDHFPVNTCCNKTAL